jgi:hypothetical protein
MAQISRALTLVIAAAFFIAACGYARAQDSTSFTVSFKDGHQKTFSTADTRIEFRNSKVVFVRDGKEESVAAGDVTKIDFSPSRTVGQNHYIGKWKVGDGVGHDFFITLQRNGKATKTRGGEHGTWTVVNGEARITWEDGWHDTIRKVGDKHEKIAHEPGKTFGDAGCCQSDATNVTAEPI